MMKASLGLRGISAELCRNLKPLRLGPPVTHVYNPLEYARVPYQEYVSRYGTAPREVLLLGMNPGPWGMAQTGIPFGTVRIVRDWLRIEGPVDRPEPENPKRPVEGFACRRDEISGLRLWGWAQQHFQTADCFFKRFFVANYCPLSFMEATGRNVTPDRLPPTERNILTGACDRALRHTVQFLQPKFVIGVGEFAERRARAALEGTNVRIGRILHPSPASPHANRGWAERATLELAKLGIRMGIPGTAPVAN